MLLAHTHSPYAWQADVDTTVVVPVLSLLYLFAVGTTRRAPLADRLLRRLDGAARDRVLVADPSPRAALPAHGAPAPERDPRGVGAAARRARCVASRWPSGSRAGAWWRFATHPAFALPLWVGNYFFWHAPPVYDAALRHQAWLIHVEHGCYFATGILFWWPLVQDLPRRLPSGARAAYAFAAFVLAAPLGLLLALVPKPAYDFYVHAPRLWGLSPITDQQIAGVTMAGEQAIVLFASSSTGSGASSPRRALFETAGDRGRGRAGSSGCARA